jgi:hypothetical protein
MRIVVVLVLSFLWSSLVQAGSITASWQNNDAEPGKALGVCLEHDLHDGQGFVPVGCVDAGATHMLVTDLPVGMTVTGRVYAYNDVGNSPYSNEASVVVPQSPFALQCSKPVALTGIRLVYSMTEGQGATVRDDSVYAAHGALLPDVTWAAGKVDNGLAFTGGPGLLLSGLRTSVTVRSIALWTYRTDVGGGGMGRLFDKRTTGAEVEALYYNTGSLTYMRVWSGGAGMWTIPAPPANAWHHIVVVYSVALPSNVPIFYVDGVAQAATTLSSPAGVALTNTDPYVFGNRGAGDRGWSGMLDEIKVYDRALLATEIPGVMGVPAP